MIIVDFSKNKIEEELNKQILNEDGRLPVFEYLESENIKISELEKKSSRFVIIGKELPFPDNWGFIIISPYLKKNYKNAIYFCIEELNKEDYKYFRDIQRYSMKTISFEGLNNICDRVMASATNFEKLCVVIDINIINEFGLSGRELLYILQRFKFLKNFKSVVIFGDDVKLIAKVIRELD